MSKAAKCLTLLGWIFETYSGTWSEGLRQENFRIRRLIAGNIIAGNY